MFLDDDKNLLQEGEFLLNDVNQLDINLSKAFIKNLVSDSIQFKEDNNIQEENEKNINESQNLEENLADSQEENNIDEIDDSILELLNSLL